MMKRNTFFLILGLIAMQLVMIVDNIYCQNSYPSSLTTVINTDTLPFLSVFEIEKNADGTPSHFNVNIPLKSKLKNDFWYSEEDLLILEQEDLEEFQLISNFQEEYQQLPATVKATLSQPTLFLLYQKDRHSFKTNAVSFTQSSVND